MSRLITRRGFLKAGSIAAALPLVPYFHEQTAQAFEAPSDRLRMGCIGVGNMGRLDASHFNSLVDIVAICDVDAEYGISRTLGCGFGRKKNGQVIPPDTSSDYRRILDRKDIDVVTIATPDHWHAKIAIEALAAGKHVFCEKPLTLTLEENLLVRAASKRHNRVFQVGTFQRSFRDQFMLAALIVRGGHLGKIERVTCNVGGGSSCAPLTKIDVPRSLDWNAWLGPAPYAEYIADNSKHHAIGPCPIHSRSHFQFRWWYEYSGGKLTDWGAHHIDCALWALNRQTPGSGPVSIDGTDSKHPVPFKDGYPTVDNQYNTCQSFNIYHTFADGLVMNVCSQSPDGLGILFEGTKGRLHVNRQRIKGRVMDEGIQDQFKPEDYVALNKGKPLDYDPEVAPPTRKKEWRIEAAAYFAHKRHFIRCIREGGTPASDVDSHVQAAHLCHLSGIAVRLGRKIQWDSAGEKIINDAQAASFFARQPRKGFEIG